MKTLSLSLLFVILGATAAQADDALVEAAKEGKAKRGRKSGTSVITNADLKKAKGKPKATTAATAASVAPEPTMTEKHQAARAAERLAADLKQAAERRIADLEKELQIVEQNYYDEDDLDRRDTILVPRFNEIKGRLDAARKELEALSPRDETPAIPTQ